MMQGEVPAPEHAAAVEKYLISTVDHGFNASTFTARVITSTGADLGAAVVGAIGALRSAARRRAEPRAADARRDRHARRAEPWLRAAVERGDRLMGFGHRVYKTDDPRSLMLREVADSLGGDKMDLARHIEATAVKVLDELKPGRRLYTNVEFYAGIVMDRCGIPRELFTPTFAASRVIGWCAHILEQAADNRLIRPSAQYVGPPPPQPVPPISWPRKTVCQRSLKIRRDGNESSNESLERFRSAVGEVGEAGTRDTASRRSPRARPRSTSDARAPSGARRRSTRRRRARSARPHAEERLVLTVVDTLEVEAVVRRNTTGPTSATASPVLSAARGGPRHRLTRRRRDRRRA